MDECVTRGVASADRVIATIGEHVIAEDTLACRCKCVRIDESTDCGVVITGLQVIESGIIVIVVTATSIFIVHIFPDTVKKNI
jgi:hypothetical protein